MEILLVCGLLGGWCLPRDLYLLYINNPYKSQMQIDLPHLPKYLYVFCYLQHNPASTPLHKALLKGWGCFQVSLCSVILAQTISAELNYTLWGEVTPPTKPLQHWATTSFHGLPSWFCKVSEGCWESRTDFLFFFFFPKNQRQFSGWTGVKEDTPQAAIKAAERSRQWPWTYCDCLQMQKSAMPDVISDTPQHNTKLKIHGNAK